MISFIIICTRVAYWTRYLNICDNPELNSVLDKGVVIYLYTVLIGISEITETDFRKKLSSLTFVNVRRQSTHKHLPAKSLAVLRPAGDGRRASRRAERAHTHGQP